jgi:hypothetical protein
MKVSFFTRRSSIFELRLTSAAFRLYQSNFGGHPFEALAFFSLGRASRFRRIGRFRPGDEDQKSLDRLPLNPLCDVEWYHNF